MSANLSHLNGSNAALTPSQAAAQGFHDFKNAGQSVRGAVVNAMERAVSGIGYVPPTGAPTAPPVAPQKPAPLTGAKVATKVDEMLIYILSQPRGHDGKNEKKFCNWVITKINKLGFSPEIMEEGAIFVRVGTEAESKTLFSCHVDSVHNSNDEDTQRLAFDPAMQHITLDTVQVKTEPKGKDPTWSSRKSGTCLGADDGAGVWLMLKMIEAKVPGGYMFHRGEERGCVSSATMARKQEAWLSQWKAAIAFDRPKDFEVITHQGGTRCASDEYGKALAIALSESPDDTLKFEISDKGGTTDTRQYRNIIPECINVGVGYFHHHTSDEYVDYEHLKALAERCCKVDWAALETHVTRDPKAIPVYGGYHGSSSSSYWQGQRDTSSYPKAPASAPAAAASANAFPKVGGKEQTKTTLEVLYNSADNIEDIMDWFEMDPELSAKCFMQALIEGRMAQIQYQMLLSKTLKA